MNQKTVKIVRFVLTIASATVTLLAKGSDGQVLERKISEEISKQLNRR